MQLEPGALLDCLKDVEILCAARRDVDRFCEALTVDAIAGVERHQVELLVGARVEQTVEVVKDLWHQVPRRAGVEPKALVLPRACTAAKSVAALKHRDIVSLARE